MILQLNGYSPGWTGCWGMDLLDQVEDHTKWLNNGTTPNFEQAISDLNKLGYTAWVEYGEPVPKLMIEVPDKEATFLALKYS